MDCLWLVVVVVLIFGTLFIEEDIYGHLQPTKISQCKIRDIVHMIPEMVTGLKNKIEFTTCAKYWGLYIIIFMSHWNVFFVNKFYVR